MTSTHSVPRAAIYGIRVPALTADLVRFFEVADPWGYILFAEACVSKPQVRALTDHLRALSGRDCMIFLDQEGGRVARLKPPEWPKFPAGNAYAQIYAHDPARGIEVCRLGFRLIANELRALGINADCAPVLDVPVAGADPIIGDRAYGASPDSIIALGQAVLDGLADGGVAGVIKHIPGHGRADVDSHLALPRVKAGLAALEADFAPFRALSHASMAMTAHVVYEAIDPDHCATHSSLVIDGLIRKDFGFDGLLMSDDLSMKALGGSFERRTKACFDAGCDVVLHCSGDLAEMEAIASETPQLSGDALRRALAADASVGAPKPFDAVAGWTRFSGHLPEFLPA